MTAAVTCLGAVLLIQLAIWLGDTQPSTTFSLRLLQAVIVLFGAAIALIRRNRKSVMAGGLLSVAMLCGCLSLAEFLLARLPIAGPASSGWKSHCPKTERNELGFRGRKFAYDDDDFVAVLLGDSQVEATACNFEGMPERLLEATLRDQVGATRVVSIGTGGYGQDQELLALREYFKLGYRADLVILWQTLENDIWNNTFPTHWPTNANPKPTYQWTDGTLTLHQDPTDFQLKDSPIHLLRLVRNLVPQKIDDAWDRGVLPEPYRPLQDRELPRRDDWQATFETRIRQGENLDNDKHHLSLFLAPTSPRVEYGIELTRALYREIETEANDHGAAFVLFHAARESESHFTQFDDVYYHGDKGIYHFAKSQRDKIASRLADGFASLVVDVTTDPYWVSQEDAHLNPKAVEEVMNKLAKRLVKTGIIKAKETPADAKPMDASRW